MRVSNLSRYNNDRQTTFKHTGHYITQIIRVVGLRGLLASSIPNIVYLLSAPIRRSERAKRQLRSSLVQPGPAHHLRRRSTRIDGRKIWQVRYRLTLAGRVVKGRVDGSAKATRSLLDRKSRCGARGAAVPDFRIFPAWTKNIKFWTYHDSIYVPDEHTQILQVHFGLFSCEPFLSSKLKTVK